MATDMKMKRYHPNATVYNRNGYYPNLNTSQEEALLQLKDKIEQTNDKQILPYIEATTEDYDLLLLRFLRARKFNVINSYDLLINDIKWRIDEEYNRQHIPYETSYEILSPEWSPTDLHQYFPTSLFGEDKEGRPVAYKHFG